MQWVRVKITKVALFLKTEGTVAVSSLPPRLCSRLTECHVILLKHFFEYAPEVNSQKFNGYSNSVINVKCVETNIERLG